MKVKDVLKQKGKDVHSADPDISVYDAIKKMSELNIGALLVLTDGKLAGIISERDYRDKVILMGKRSKDTSVSELEQTFLFFIQFHGTV